MAGAANKFEGLTCSADVGRINPEETFLEKPTIVCPEMTVAWVPLSKPTMTETQCRIRIQENNRCTVTCKAISHLKP